MPRPRLESASWWPDLLELKDELSLAELSDKFGVSINGLSRALKRAGVERKTVRRGRGPAKKPNKPRKGPDPRSAEAQAWWPDFLALKDKKSLAELAKKFEVAEITLQRAMKRTGTDRKSQRGATGSRKARSTARRLSPLTHLLGKLPDAQVAAQAGVSKYQVAQYRKRKGIPSVRDAGKAAPAASSASPAPAAAAGARTAWLVRVSDDSRYVVVGGDLAEAAAQAQRALAGRGTIEALELLGTAL